MKIIAESRPVSAVPYLHLGYAAAVDMVSVLGLGLVGLSFLVVGVCVLAGIPVSGTRSRVNSPQLVGKKRTIAAVVALVLAAASALLLVGQLRAERRRIVALKTWHHQMYVVKGLKHSAVVVETPGVPKSEMLFREFPLAAGVYDLTALEVDLDATYLYDSWDQPMRLNVATNGVGGQVYVVRSRGRDGEWDTADDVTQSYTHEPTVGVNGEAMLAPGRRGYDLGPGS